MARFKIYFSSRPCRRRPRRNRGRELYQPVIEEGEATLHRVGHRHAVALR